MRRQQSPRSHRPRLVAALFILLVLLVSLPTIANLTVKYLLIRGAAARDVRLTIGGVHFNLFNSTILYDVRWNNTRGAITSAVIERATLEFAPWRGLNGRRWIDSLELEGMNVVLDLGAATTGDFKDGDEKAAPSYFVPHELVVLNANFLIKHPLGHLRCRSVRLTASENARGTVQVSEMDFLIKDRRRSFTDLQGWSLLAGSQLRIGGLIVAEHMRLELFELDLERISAGNLTASAGLAAFGGAIRAELRARPSGLEAGGSLSQISIEQLSDFVGSTKNAGGTLRLAKFSYRGGRLDNAALSLRAEIIGFHWGERQFDSLVAGATLIGNRLQIPELELTQARNELSLSGEMPIADWAQWWRSDFNVNVSARIERLEELSALFGPALAGTSGQATIDGSIRSQNENLRGQLIASGSKLSVNDVRLGTLDVAVRFRGDDLEITNFQLLNTHDFFRSRGVVNIRGERRYAGELQCSIANVSQYQPLLPRQMREMRGAIAVDWWGDGTREAHSGAFNCALSEFSPAPRISPLKLTAEGTYSPAEFYLRYVTAANRHAEISCHIGGDGKQLRFNDVRLKAGTGTLQGDLWLPINIYAAVRNGFFRFDLNEEIHTNLRAQQLQLSAVFAGFDLPVRGVLSGEVSVAGTLRSPQLSGKIEIKNGGYANAWSDVDMAAKFSEHTANIESLSARTPAGATRATGEFVLDDLLNPLLNLSLQLGEATIELSSGTRARMAVNGTIAGRWQAATVTANAELDDIAFVEGLKLDEFLSDRPLFEIRQQPFRDWQLQADLATPKPVRINGGWAEAALHVSGRASAPETNGRLMLHNCTVELHDEQRRIADGAIYFLPAATRAIFLRTQAGRFIFGTTEEIQEIAADFPTPRLSNIKSIDVVHRSMPDRSSEPAFAAQSFRLEMMN